MEYMFYPVLPYLYEKSRTSCTTDTRSHDMRNSNVWVMMKKKHSKRSLRHSRTDNVTNTQQVYCNIYTKFSTHVLPELYPICLLSTHRASERQKWGHDGKVPSGSHAKYGVTLLKTTSYAYENKKKNPLFLSLFIVICHYFGRFFYLRAPPLFLGRTQKRSTSTSEAHRSLKKHSTLNSKGRILVDVQFLSINNQNIKTTMKYPTTRFVFDRKNISTKKVPAAVQVEILYKGKKKYISTGVKLCKNEWDRKRFAVNRFDIIEINRRIVSFKNVIDGYINDLIKEEVPWSWDEFNQFLLKAEDEKETFIEYAARRIEERTDIQESTRKAQRKLIKSLREYKRIITFKDLTSGKILSYYEWLQGRTVTRYNPDGTTYEARMSPNTVRDYMKFLKHYVHDAIAHELLDNDPTVAIKVKRGKPASERYLTPEEVEKIASVKLFNPMLSRVRDLFIFTCYTGLAFCDLMDMSSAKIEDDGEHTYLSGNRTKTGEEYVVLLLPQAERILKKYKFNLPKYSNQKYNQCLKELAQLAGISKPVSSHWGRHTAAMMLLNAGVRIEVVSRVLGHSSITETQRTYSKVLKKTVVSEMSKVF